MKMTIKFLFIFLLFLFSCSSSDTELVDLIEFKTVGFKVTLNNPVEIKLLDSMERNLYFEIIPLQGEVYASRVKPSELVQILDNSTYGYPDALELDSIINEEQNWTPSRNYVLGTSVGNGGLFEGKGLKYLGFRILNDGDYQYGWISIINNEGNTSVEIDSYAINLTNGRSILAGQTE